MSELIDNIKNNVQELTKSHWKALVAEYQQSHFWRATWQLFSTLGAYLGLWVLMYFTHEISWWLTIPLAILAAGVLVRVFIIFHDCGHRSFYKSRWANDLWGFVTGIMTFTPYYHWRWEHVIHHASSGHLDRRGIGDIWTMTVAEYEQASRWKRLGYRLVRNPFILFIVAPLYIFLLRERFPTAGAKTRERMSVWITDLALVMISWGLISAFGFLAWLTILLTIMGVSGAAGIWLFYVQHQYEDTYWAKGEDWDYTAAAIKGSSYYKLPRVLQWFSGNIGFHHIHHLSPRIPNYSLERCHFSHPLFSQVKEMTLWSSLKTIRLRLWDEQAERLISFREWARQRRAAASMAG